ncbi:hypothetical protein PCAR4_90043 [Paraburkholderia caribensis]|nr:hypothetical protein PCAR4_90043 [Paraburkholderia caribensis]
MRESTLIKLTTEAILKSLLFEADFFVDEKDLQTFVGATSQESRFFFALFAPVTALTH